MSRATNNHQNLYRFQPTSYMRKLLLFLKGKEGHLKSTTSKITTKLMTFIRDSLWETIPKQQQQQKTQIQLNHRDPRKTIVVCTLYIFINCSHRARTVFYLVVIMFQFQFNAEVLKREREMKNQKQRQRQPISN